MKNLLFFLCLLFSAFNLNAQVTPPPRGSSYQDSVRSGGSSDKVTMVNGVPMSSAKDFIENITQSKLHTLLLASVRAASLVGTLKSRGPLTFFAPNDSAFIKKFGTRLDTLVKPAHKYELINILSYHVVPGLYNAKELTKQIKAGKGEVTLLTLSGSKLTARIDSNRNIVLFDETGGQSVISRFDIEQSNGILHLVTQVLMPKNKAM